MNATSGVLKVRTALCLALAALPGVVHGQAGGPAVVEVAPLVQREVSAGQTFVGTVQPLKAATVGSAVSGRVIEFPVNEGDRVEKGQPLAQLLTESVELELAAARGELVLRQQALRELENGSRPKEIEQARARMAGARATMEFLLASRKRTESLYRQGQAVSEEQLQQAVAAEAEARAAYEEAKAAYELAVEGPRVEVIAQAKAQVAIQEAVVGRLESEMSKYTIISRFDGYVVAEHTEVGSWVNSGDPVADVIALDQVDIEVYVLESHTPYVHVGQSVRVEIPALPQEALTGTVALVVPQADIRTRTFPVKVRVENTLRGEEPLLKSGMMASVMLQTGASEEALLAPKGALVLGGELPYVWVIDPREAKVVADPVSGTKFHQAAVRDVPVRLGVAEGPLVQVTGEDLRPGLLVVSKGNERIRPSRPNQPPLVKWPVDGTSRNVAVAGGE